MRAIAALLLPPVLVGLTGCSAPEIACTQIGAPSGVSVTVDAEIARDVISLEASACWGGKCTTAPVELSPGYDTIDQGCDGTEPDAACSASASPNGTLTGFLDVAELPAEQITVRATAQLSDRKRSFADASVTPETVYPNGPNCPGAGNQVKITISDAGIR